jgi:hypothetical protein
MDGPDLDAPEVAGVLGEAHHLVVGILTRRGPHVTPELFVVSAGRLWCLVAASTLKARRLAGGGQVAVAASSGPRHLLATGRATVVDPTHPVRNLRDVRTSVAAPGAVGQFALRNAAELAGAALDLFTGRLGGPLPPHRVALCIEPTAATVFDEGAGARDDPPWSSAPEPDVRAHDGPDATGDDDPAEEVVEAVPDDLRALATDGPAAVGWTTAGGHPLVLPCRWAAERRELRVPEHAFAVTRAASTSRAAVMRDCWTGLGPSGKQGVMIRGDGTVQTADDGVVTIGLVPDSVISWDGIATETTTPG